MSTQENNYNEMMQRFAIPEDFSRRCIDIETSRYQDFCLVEECSEVIKEVTKLNRKESTDTAKLTEEIGDLFIVLQTAIINHNLSVDDIAKSIQYKVERTEKYLDEQEPIEDVDPESAIKASNHTDTSTQERKAIEPDMVKELNRILKTLKCAFIIEENRIPNSAIWDHTYRISLSSKMFVDSFIVNITDEFLRLLTEFFAEKGIRLQFNNTRNIFWSI